MLCVRCDTCCAYVVVHAVYDVIHAICTVLISTKHNVSTHQIRENIVLRLVWIRTRM